MASELAHTWLHIPLTDMDRDHSIAYDLLCRLTRKFKMDGDPMLTYFFQAWSTDHNQPGFTQDYRFYKT